MWAIRRASANYLRAYGLNATAFRSRGATVKPYKPHEEDNLTIFDLHSFKRQITSKTCTSSRASWNHLETSGTRDSDSESDRFETEVKSKEKKAASCGVGKLVLETSRSVSDVLEEYFEGKELCRYEVSRLLLYLRTCKFFRKAMEVSEWLESRDEYIFTEQDYAFRLNLIAKLHGLTKAETYLDKIPKPFKNELVYKSLLKNFISASLVEKSEQLFNKIKTLGFPITISTYNHMLLLYKKTNHRKIGDLLQTMEMEMEMENEEGLKPSLFTYQVLIDVKGKMKDIEGMEKVVEAMKEEGLEPDVFIKAVLARHYVGAKLRGKAEEILKDIEMCDFLTTRFIYPIILRLYADLRKPEEVERIWKSVESSPRQPEFLATITAWGKLNNVEKSETVFNQMTETYKRNLSTKQWNTMLRVYTSNKMLTKANQLLKQMTDAQRDIDPLSCDALVKLCLDVGQVEEAVTLLHKATQNNRHHQRPKINTYTNVLTNFSKNGDVVNSERVFWLMKRAGHVVGSKQFNSLLRLI